MKKLIAYALLFMMCMTASAQNFENATQAVKNMGLGWNLGNTLDANNQSIHDINNVAYWGQQDLSSETCWGQPYTKSELIKMMKNAGFGVIRVPVTWYNHMDASGKVDAEWMKRVHEIVDYVISEGMYCIINVHHDTGADSYNGSQLTGYHWIKADMDNYNQNKARYEYLWRQIAEEFKDYDQHLLFEGYNEMLDKLSSWCFASFSSANKYDATIATSAYKAINSYAQSFVNAVRATGGNNAQRNLVVNTYGSCSGEGTWNSHLKEPLTNMALPQDNVPGHIAFQIHCYPNISNGFASVKSGLDAMFANLKTYLGNKGPVIIGEWGTSNVDAGNGKTDYDVRRNEVFNLVDYFIAKAKSMDMATIYWMGLTDGSNRQIPAFNQPDLAERMAKAYHGSSFQGEYPAVGSSELSVLFEGNKKLGWGDGITIPAAAFTEANKTRYLEISYKADGADGDDIQFYYGDWSAKPSVIVDSKSFAGDFNPTTYYTDGSKQHRTPFRFSNASYAILAQKGLIIHGNGITLTKVEFVSTPTGIGNVKAETATGNHAIYDLQGRRVLNPQHGIYIQNGKKVIL